MYNTKGITIRTTEKCGIINQNINNDDYLKKFELCKLKNKNIEEERSKHLKEILDNYRYLEIKYLKKSDLRSRSIVVHKRLSKPIVKKIEYKRGYYSKSPTLRQMNRERGYYNQNETRKAATINPNYSYKNFKNSTYQVNQSYQNPNISTIRNQPKFSVNSKITQTTKSIQEEYPINTNQQIYSSYPKMININQINNEDLYQNNYYQQNERFKSPVQKQSIRQEDDYCRYQPLTESSEICKICGKPKRTGGIYSSKKSNKSIKRELIAEEISDNNFVIRYGAENETRNEPHFETFRAPGTKFCPIHGYV